jgi:hypothetical protein
LRFYLQSGLFRLGINEEDIQEQVNFNKKNAGPGKNAGKDASKDLMKNDSKKTLKSTKNANPEQARLEIEAQIASLEDKIKEMEGNL